MSYFFWCAIAYFVGSLSFAHIVSKLLNLPDPTNYGSGNAGATNVLRTGNRKAAYLVLIGDLLKGGGMVVVCRWINQNLDNTNEFVALVSICVFLGHLYPIFFNFRGGKGVATSGGILCVLDPLFGLTAIFVWITVAVVTRYSSLAAIVAGVITCLIVAIFPTESAVDYSINFIIFMILIKHRTNIGNLIKGTETKIKLTTSVNTPRK